MAPTSEWEGEAERWVRWARTPGHDAYWEHRDGFFDAVVPPPGRRTIEVGCGEGRVSRDLVARGHAVVGVDSSPTLLRHAREADPRSAYVLADAAALPFHAGSFDVAVAYNSLMDVEDMPAAVGEVARVLRTGGRLCVTVTHPISDAGRFADASPDAPFVIEGSYFGRHRVELTAEREGLAMTFRGWRYALEDYAHALGGHGLVIEALREPRPGALGADSSDSDPRWHRIPMFLQLRARKL